MFLECGQERGADAIENISYVLGNRENPDKRTNSYIYGCVCRKISDDRLTEIISRKAVRWHERLFKKND